MKKIIMIAMYFPPAAGVGTFRITKFVKYLSGYGWSPTVITLNEAEYTRNQIKIDRSLIGDIPLGTKIIRTGISKPIIFRKTLSGVMDINWLPMLIYTLLKEIKQEKTALVYATSGPGFPLVAAAIAKIIWKIPYVVDFRDPWKSEKITKEKTGIKSQIYRKLINLLEPIVIKNASKIICVSEGMNQNFREAYPKIPSSDFVVISNGYDPCDYDNVDAYKFPFFTVVYAGKFLSMPYFRNPKFFFEALKMLNERGLRIKFRHVGDIDAEVVQIAKDCLVYHLCEFTGNLTYTETIKNMKGADLLLLIGTGDNIEQTGKIFDYLGCKKPVLALANNSSGIADVVREINHVRLIENGNAQLIAHEIEDTFHFPESIVVNDSQLTKYHRSTLTRQLVDLLDNVIADKDAAANS